MEQDYKIIWVEKKTTSTGKEKWDATVTDSAGVKHEKVTMWASDWPELINGGSVRGTLVEKQNGQYLNKTLYPVKMVAKTNGGGFKSHLIEKTMTQKREDIAHSQDRKEYGIRVASTFNQAVALAIAEFHEQRRLSASGPTLEQLIKKWREWCWMNWEMDESNEVTPF